LFAGQGVGERADCLLQGWQVVINGGLQNGVRSVEVAVRQVVAHPRDLRHAMEGCDARRSSGSALNASPISSRRMRTASKTSPSDRQPRCICEWIASMAAWMSASR